MKNNNSFILVIFKRSATDKGLFNAINPDKRMPFNYFRASLPKNDYLKVQGAEAVINSWIDSIGGRKKVLHTGLRYYGEDIFYGDNLNGNESKPKDFIIIKMIGKDIRQLFYFKGKNPRNPKKFIDEFIKQKRQHN